ncbi:MAG: hypothetical protein J0I80_15120 [Sphingomonas sp.]|nr:hypothetical protein [Sphingomonas sp.]
MKPILPARLFPLLLLSAFAVLSWPASARDVLGVFQRWGAFRDAQQGRCFAIAQPLAGGWESSPWRPFAAVGYWPRQGLRGQFAVRLSHALAPGNGATLTVGEQRFILNGGGADVWAGDRRADAAIIAAIRSGQSMAISGRARAGGRFTDRYDLRGAATAIDAAALGCARIK